VREPEEDFYGMARDISQAELHRKTSKLEMLVYLCLLGVMFAAEIFIMNPR
jgi:hypothetical protein